MSLDHRLRDELHRDAERVTADVERNLGAVEARARRRNGLGMPTLVLAVSVLAIVVVLRVSGAPGPNGSRPSSPPVPSAATSQPTVDFAAIAGTYAVTLDASNATVASFHLGGAWTMRLASDGEIFLSPPSSFGSGTSSLSGLAFNLAGDRFRNNIFYNDFCGSVGTYTWSLAGGHLSFAPVDDGCAIRRALLATAAWSAQP